MIVGSLRRESLNRKAANAIAALAPASLRFEIVEIGQLPFYNQDLDAAPPAEWTAFRDRVRAADAVLFVTPEYNRSVPGVLKNAIDVGSRPYGKSVWSGKPAGVVSVSPGAIGGFGANHHLRQSLVYLDMPTLAQPEAYIGGAARCLTTAAKSRTTTGGSCSRSSSRPLRPGSRSTEIRPQHRVQVRQHPPRRRAVAVDRPRHHRPVQRHLDQARDLAGPRRAREFAGGDRRLDERGQLARVALAWLSSP